MSHQKHCDIKNRGGWGEIVFYRLYSPWPCPHTNQPVHTRDTFSPAAWTPVSSAHFAACHDTEKATEPTGTALPKSTRPTLEQFPLSMPKDSPSILLLLYPSLSPPKKLQRHTRGILGTRRVSRVTRRVSWMWLMLPHTPAAQALPWRISLSLSSRQC